MLPPALPTCLQLRVGAALACRAAGHVGFSRAVVPRGLLTDWCCGALAV